MTVIASGITFFSKDNSSLLQCKIHTYPSEDTFQAMETEMFCFFLCLIESMSKNTPGRWQNMVKKELLHKFRVLLIDKFGH